MENRDLRRYVELIMEVNLLRNMEKFIINYMRKVCNVWRMLIIYVRKIVNMKHSLKNWVKTKKELYKENRNKNKNRRKKWFNKIPLVYTCYLI